MRSDATVSQDVIKVFTLYTGHGVKVTHGRRRLAETCCACGETPYLTDDAVHGVACNACGSQVAAPGTYVVAPVTTAV